ncbi:MAG: thiazole biosynthesis adenylyltransferase ThiF [Acidobacteriota bacterium]
MELERYSRQVLFRGIGREGQRRLAEAVVAVVGCGALGSSSAEQLVRAGVGTLRLIDRDFVEWSNLQRQSLYEEEDARLGRPKAVAAAERLRKINSEIRIEEHVADLTFANAGALLEGCAVVVDGSDNFEVRYLLNDYAVSERVPWIYGGAVGSYGLAMAVVPETTACLRCLFPDQPPAGAAETCDTVGVIAPVIHVVASFQVVQVLRLLVGEQPAPGLLTVDVWNDEWRRIRSVARRSDCECCGRRRFPYLEGRRGADTVRLCGRDAVQVRPSGSGPLDLEALAARLQEVGRVQSSPYLLRFPVGELEVTVFRDGRAIIKGTDDPAEARSVYSRYIGF